MTSAANADRAPNGTEPAQDSSRETYILDLMRLEDIPEVSRVEQRCFTNPWPESAYRRELRNPAGNYYIVLRHRPATQPGETSGEQRSRLPLLPLMRRSERPATDPIVGFAGMWILYDESHITTIGIAPEHRGRGLGELLIVTLFDEAVRRNAQWVTLEVRVSNSVAQSLYLKYGFTKQGLRKRYYSDNGEDADIMWSPSLRDHRYMEEFDRLKGELLDRLRSRYGLIDKRAP